MRISDWSSDVCSSDLDSGCHAAVKESRQFALNMIGKGQQGAAFAFFKPAEVEDGKISGEAFRPGDNGAPIIASAIAAVERSEERRVRQECASTCRSRCAT